MSAQNTTEIAVTPAVVDIPVEPGMSFDSAIRVRNGSDQSLPISVIAQSLIVDDEPLGSINRGRYDVSSWIRFKSSSLLLEPGGSQLVEFTITVPQDASPGGHYAQINMRALQLEKELVSDNTTIIFPEVSVPVILTVPGEINEDVLIVNTDLVPTIISPGSQLQTEVVIENNGNIHNVVRPELFVFSDDSEKPFLYTSEPSVILPQTTKTVPIDWTAPALSGVVRAEIRMTFGTDTQMVKTETDTYIATMNVRSHIALAVATWLVVYIYIHRLNVTPSLRALFGRTP